LKTKEEVLARITEKKKEFFDFSLACFCKYLSFDDIKIWLKPEAKKEDWPDIELWPDDQKIIADMRDYMSFAWSKCLDHRGLSASRSVDRMNHWCWFLGVEDSIDWDNYAQYGAPILYAICKKFDFPIPDDPNVEIMVRGELS